ncbi:hypothetical protein NDR87_31010 [Nocardia sp. CDC159]|uniref:Uncharacterized protein n=1 Tax=Nocardia pulmonis TaxID=2951408 RepID=A0A9X2EBV2_9NOCA|nr:MULTISPECIES: hypothetical protein [Nocardia]MCM6778019.1 hypothetical protein [Nocardia pulmonis]MCM6790810.1 hypothetical protein [Nocardia sp. CDC159]
MTTPGGSPTSDAFVVGSAYGSDLNEESVKAIATGGARVSFEGVQSGVNSQIRTRIDGAYAAVEIAQGSADQAVTTAQAAANSAAAAVETADIAYDNASYWESECVVASAAVLLGVNELLIGLAQNVPTGRTRKITDLHIALLSQPNGMVIETKKFNSTGTSSSVVHTASLGANVTRINYQNLNINVADKERIFWNVASITGSTAPTALQILVFGVIL